MTALVDANVVMDVLLAREPFLSDSAQVVKAVETGRCRGLLCATTMTTLYHIVRRAQGGAVTMGKIKGLLAIFEIAPVNRAVLETATRRAMPDFEDAVQHQSAVFAGADCVVTRNVVDFRTADLAIHTPSQFLKVLALEEYREV